MAASQEYDAFAAWEAGDPVVAPTVKQTLTFENEPSNVTSVPTTASTLAPMTSETALQNDIPTSWTHFSPVETTPVRKQSSQQSPESTKQPVFDSSQTNAAAKSSSTTLSSASPYTASQSNVPPSSNQDVNQRRGSEMAVPDANANQPSSSSQQKPSSVPAIAAKAEKPPSPTSVFHAESGSVHASSEQDLQETAETNNNTSSVNDQIEQPTSSVQRALEAARESEALAKAQLAQAVSTISALVDADNSRRNRFKLRVPKYPGAATAAAGEAPVDATVGVMFRGVLDAVSRRGHTAIESVRHVLSKSNGSNNPSYNTPASSSIHGNAIGTPADSAKARYSRRSGDVLLIASLPHDESTSESSTAPVTAPDVAAALLARGEIANATIDAVMGQTPSQLPAALRTPRNLSGNVWNNNGSVNTSYTAAAGTGLTTFATPSPLDHTRSSVRQKGTVTGSGSIRDSTGITATPATPATPFQTGAAAVPTPAPPEAVAAAAAHLARHQSNDGNALHNPRVDAAAYAAAVADREELQREVFHLRIERTRLRGALSAALDAADRAGSHIGEAISHAAAAGANSGSSSRPIPSLSQTSSSHSTVTTTTRENTARSSSSGMEDAHSQRLRAELEPRIRLEIEREVVARVTAESHAALAAERVRAMQELRTQFEQRFASETSAAVASAVKTATDAAAAQYAAERAAAEQQRAADIQAARQQGRSDERAELLPQLKAKLAAVLERAEADARAAATQHANAMAAALAAAATEREQLAARLASATNELHAMRAEMNTATAASQAEVDDLRKQLEVLRAATDEARSAAELTSAIDVTALRTSIEAQLRVEYAAAAASTVSTSDAAVMTSTTSGDDNSVRSHSASEPQPQQPAASVDQIEPVVVLESANENMPALRANIEADVRSEYEVRAAAAAAKAVEQVNDAFARGRAEARAELLPQLKAKLAAVMEANDVQRRADAAQHATEISRLEAIVAASASEVSELRTQLDAAAARVQALQEASHMSFPTASVAVEAQLVVPHLDASTMTTALAPSPVSIVATATADASCGPTESSHSVSSNTQTDMTELSTQAHSNAVATTTTSTELMTTSAVTTHPVSEASLASAVAAAFERGRVETRNELLPQLQAKIAAVLDASDAQRRSDMEALAAITAKLADADTHIAELRETVANLQSALTQSQTQREAHAKRPVTMEVGTSTPIALQPPRTFTDAVVETRSAEPQNVSASTGPISSTSAALVTPSATTVSSDSAQAIEFASDTLLSPSVSTSVARLERLKAQQLEDELHAERTLREAAEAASAAANERAAVDAAQAAASYSAAVAATEAARADAERAHAEVAKLRAAQSERSAAQSMTAAAAVELQTRVTALEAALADERAAAKELRLQATSAGAAIDAQFTAAAALREEARVALEAAAAAEARADAAAAAEAASAHQRAQLTAQLEAAMELLRSATAGEATAKAAAESAAAALERERIMNAALEGRQAQIESARAAAADADATEKMRLEAEAHRLARALGDIELECARLRNIASESEAALAEARVQCETSANAAVAARAETETLRLQLETLRLTITRTPKAAIPTTPASTGNAYHPLGAAVVGARSDAENTANWTSAPSTARSSAGASADSSKLAQLDAPVVPGQILRRSPLQQTPQQMPRVRSRSAAEGENVSPLVQTALTGLATPAAVEKVSPPSKLLSGGGTPLIETIAGRTHLTTPPRTPVVDASTRRTQADGEVTPMQPSNRLTTGAGTTPKAKMEFVAPISSGPLNGVPPSPSMQRRMDYLSDALERALTGEAAAMADAERLRRVLDTVQARIDSRAAEMEAATNNLLSRMGSNSSGGGSGSISRTPTRDQPIETASPGNAASTGRGATESPQPARRFQAVPTRTPQTRQNSSVQGTLSPTTASKQLRSPLNGGMGEHNTNTLGKDGASRRDVTVIAAEGRAREAMLQAEAKRVRSPAQQAAAELVRSVRKTYQLVNSNSPLQKKEGVTMVEASTSPVVATSNTESAAVTALAMKPIAPKPLPGSLVLSASAAVSAGNEPDERLRVESAKQAYHHTAPGPMPMPDLSALPLLSRSLARRLPQSLATAHSGGSVVPAPITMASANANSAVSPPPALPTVHHLPANAAQLAAVVVSSPVQPQQRSNRSASTSAVHATGRGNSGTSASPTTPATPLTSSATNSASTGRGTYLSPAVTALATSLLFPQRTTATPGHLTSAATSRTPAYTLRYGAYAQSHTPLSARDSAALLVPSSFSKERGPAPMCFSYSRTV